MTQATPPVDREAVNQPSVMPGITEPSTTPASAFASRWQTTYTREISPGFWVKLKKLPLTGEILRGTLPNQVMRRIKFEMQPFLDERSEEEKQRDNLEAALPVLARAMVEPKFVWNSRGDVQPDVEKGEIGPEHLSYVEIDNLYFYIIREVVPPAATAPFPDRGDGDQATGGSTPTG